MTTLPPSIERRESDPHAYSRQFKNDTPLQDAYEHHVNDACRAIQAMPLGLVDSAYIGQVLSTLACKATEAMLPEVAESLDVLADEVAG